MAERDMQKDLEAVKEDLSKLRSDIADLTQKLLDMGRARPARRGIGSKRRPATSGENCARR
jgi:hypothetical protein